MIALTGDVIYGGNFHASPIGFCRYGMALALAENRAISGTRIAKADRCASHRLACRFSIAGGDLYSPSSFVAEWTAAALSSENKCSPLGHLMSSPTANARGFRGMAHSRPTPYDTLRDNIARKSLAIECWPPARAEFAVLSAPEQRP